jgi:hypothetical protein
LQRHREEAKVATTVKRAVATSDRRATANQPRVFIDHDGDASTSGSAGN